MERKQNLCQDTYSLSQGDTSRQSVDAKSLVFLKCSERFLHVDVRSTVHGSVLGGTTF